MSLTDNLRVLEQAGLISLAASQPEPQFTFRHELVQQAAYNTYLKTQRRRVHQVIAEVLEQAETDPTWAAEHTADLAYHYWEAGNWAKARDFARRAGERSAARYAPREALLHFSLALEAAAQLGAPPPTDLLLARGLAHELVGSFEHAQADYMAAMEQAHAAGEWQIEWRTLLDIGLLWASRDYTRTGPYYRQALQLAQAKGDAATLAHSLNRLGNWHFNAGENLAALRYHEEALAIFQRLEARRGLAETYDHLGMVHTVLGQMRQGYASYEQAVTLFRELDDRLGLVNSLATMAEQGPSVHTDTAALLAPAAEAREHGRLALQLARQIGFRSGEVYALCSLAGLLVMQGDYAEAMPAMHTALHIAEEIGHRQWQTFARALCGVVCQALLRHTEALAYLEPAYTLAREIKSAIWVAATTAILAMVHLERGDLDKSQALLDQHRLPADAPNLQERLLMAARAELALAQDQPERALDIAQALIDTTPELEPGVVIPRLWHLRGRSLHALGRRAEALTDLQDASAAAQRQGTRPLAWRIRLDLAALYAAQGQSAEAQAELAAALALVDSLAAGVPDPQWGDDFRQRAALLIAEFSSKPGR